MFRPRGARRVSHGARPGASHPPVMAAGGGGLSRPQRKRRGRLIRLRAQGSTAGGASRTASAGAVAATE